MYRMLSGGRSKRYGRYCICNPGGLGSPSRANPLVAPHVRREFLQLAMGMLWPRCRRTPPRFRQGKFDSCGLPIQPHCTGRSAVSLNVRWPCISGRWCLSPSCKPCPLSFRHDGGRLLGVRLVNDGVRRIPHTLARIAALYAVRHDACFRFRRSSKSSYARRSHEHQSRL